MNSSIRYILLWTSTYFGPFSKFSSPEDFTKRNCVFTNCFVTYDRKYFGSSFGRFDAVFFDGYNINQVNVNQLYRIRSTRQKFVFIITEPSEIYPVYNKHFDNFFNWTATYKLNSDIPIPYISVRNKINEVIGPKRIMHWKTDFEEIDEELSQLLLGKTKAAAWYVTEHKTRSKREDYVKYLDAALQLYGFRMDTFVKCGPPNATHSAFLQVLEKDYFFYLAFENTFVDDYVTEEVLTALLNHTVPIVFGGANYSRFLPPGSYLNARDHTPEELSYIMRQIMWNPASLNRRFFRWRSHYTFKTGDSSYVCDICATLNNETLVQTKTVYRRFRRWWNIKQDDDE